MPLPGTLKIPKQPTRSGPVWEGPSGTGPNGGVSQSLISRYLACKERYRIYAMEGLKPKEGFNSRLEFGNMWHVCKESLVGHKIGICPTCDGEWTKEKADKLDEAPPPATCPNCVGDPTNPFLDWKLKLKDYCEHLSRKYRSDVEQIDHWYNVTRALFPVYLEYWNEINPDKTKRTPLLREQPFDVQYKLPGGRSVRLRGKWDGVDLVEGKWIELYEHKTKSQIDSDKISRQLTFDLQTLLYLIALDAPDGLAMYATNGRHPIKGVRYNVVRRSAHKSVDSMMKKVTEDYKAGRIGEWFARWDVPVHQSDYNNFKYHCLEPVLENLLDDYEWWVYCESIGNKSPFVYEQRSQKFPKHLNRHFRYPYGVWNPVAEGGFGEIDEYMRSGSEVGLERVMTLFPELEG